MVENAKAEHIIGGDIYWECVTTGPDAGKFIFYLKLYRDCAVNSVVSSQGHFLQITNHPTFTGNIDLNLISQSDITQPGCGVSCAGASPGDIATEQFVFASDPIAITGTPPANGFIITYHRCCRNSVTNLANADQQEIYYTATMYPFNGQDVFPCYDSSPQFAENPTSLLCSGYELRYNSNATDSDLDSLSYELAPALGTNGAQMSYAAGYSPIYPLPGSTIDPSYDDVTVDPVTGQLEYDGPGGLQGRWNVVIAVTGWRCGQIVSRTIREMSVTIIPCAEPNNIPVITSPNWTAPATGAGYEVTVLAGDLVNFTLTGTDNDVTNGIPQVLELTAVGSQFGANFTNAAAGCANAPCATLSNVTPPATGNGSISTTFNWQTSCNHIANQDACANFSNTYNFIFKYQDDYCPARATVMTNVTVTVLAEPVVPSPIPHCVSTEANGDITISWEPVTDNAVPPSFVEYVIFHSTSANGPWTEIDTDQNINATGYSHTAGNPVAGPTTSGANYYLIRTRSGCNDAVLDVPIDTISSIFLTLNNTGATADLSWTAVATPPLPSSNGNGQGLYQVYKEYPAGTWTLIGTTFDLFYSDPVTVCNEWVNYRIELTDNLPCVSVSNVVGELLNNPAQPDPQKIDSVTVDLATQLARISWTENGQLNVTEYIVEQNPDFVAWGEVHTAVGYNNTDWINPNSNARTESEYYRLKATNNCLITGPPGDPFHKTIWLKVAVDTCDKSALLEWESYENWDTGVERYDVYTSINGATEVKIGTTPDTVRQFTHYDLLEDGDYCYHVRAIKNSATRITSTSNDTCIHVYVPKRPEYSYNYNATVVSGNTGVEDYFFVDSTAGYLGFQILRSTEPESLSYVWFLEFDPNTQYYQYTDNTARPASNSYYYTVVGIDSCNLEADTLNLSRTMLLEAEANTNRTNTITWNAYEGWRGGVIAYNIYRSVDGVYEFLKTVPPNQLTYVDSIQEIIIGEGNFCYYIEAVEGIGAPVGPDAVQFQELSNSNEACAFQPPNVFIPNAFMPEGVNNVLKPVTVYVDVDDYLFQVYTRWGELVFQSNDPMIGWDGNVKGKKGPQGAYAYFVRFVSSKGDTFTKSGTVTLLR